MLVRLPVTGFLQKEILLNQLKKISGHCYSLTPLPFLTDSQKQKTYYYYPKELWPLFLYVRLAIIEKKENSGTILYQEIYVTLQRKKSKQENGKSKRCFLGSEGFRLQVVVSYRCPKGLHAGVWRNRGFCG